MTLDISYIVCDTEFDTLIGREPERLEFEELGLCCARRRVAWEGSWYRYWNCDSDQKRGEYRDEELSTLHSCNLSLRGQYLLTTSSRRNSFSAQKVTRTSSSGYGCS